MKFYMIERENKLIQILWFRYLGAEKNAVYVTPGWWLLPEHFPLTDFASHSFLSLHY